MIQRLVLIIGYSYLVRWFLKIIVGVNFQRADFLKDEKQFILVANHNSHLDTMTLMAALPSSIIHLVRPVAAADHFGKTSLKKHLTNFFVNSLLIQRKRDKENPENDPINQMIKALDDGYSLIIFPEGTRGEPEVQQPLKPGVALVLRERPHVKFVSAYMKGLGNAMPKDKSILLPYKSYLIFGNFKTIPSKETDDILNIIQQDFNKLRKQLKNII